MKKLIAMIGAVATAFGLYAATPFATSFETRDEGVSEGTFTPGDGWTWQSSDALTLGVYAGDAFTYGTGALGRRDDSFVDTDNLKYLKLETGTNALTRAVGEGNVFLDQLVKFTGFEEYQTNVVAGTKIAVWMSGIEQEGTATWVEEVPAKEAETNDQGEVISPATQAVEAHFEYSDDYIASETNLYITCAKVAGGKVEPVALKIDGDYELNKWYRLTIKSLGSIYGEEPTDADRAGFIVYIDGQQVAAVGDEAKTLIQYASEMTDLAKGYMAEGQLFPAIGTTDATFAKVGYQGIGAIDDIILDTDGPEFARMVPVTAEQLGIPGVKIVKVEQEGKVVTGEGTWTVKPGDIVVWYAPDGAFVVKGQGYATWKYNDGKWEQDTASSDIEVAEAVAKIVNVATPTEVTYIDEDDLAELTGLANGDTATILQSCEIQNEDGDTLYSFTPNTTISVAEGGIWNVFIDKWVFDNKGVLADKAGELYDNFGLLASKTVNVTFGEKVGKNLCTLYIEGAIAGNITAGDNGVVVINNDGVETTLSGTITAANVEVSDNVTLVENGKLITMDDSIESILDGEGTTVVPTADTPEEGWYTYALVTEPTQTGFAIIIADADPVTTNYYETLDAAIEAAGTEDEELGVVLPMTVTILADFEIEQTVAINKAITLDLNGYTATLAADLATGIQATEAGTVTILNGKIASAADRENIAGSKAIYFLRTSAVLTDVEIDVPGFDYALTHMGNIADLGKDRNEYWTVETPYTLDCNNVDVKGNGSLFHLEYVKADLDAACSAIQYTDKGYFSAAHQAAIYSSCGAVVTVNGGTYTAVNALQTGNLGGDIIVNSGAFNGNIMSFMYKGDIRYEGNAASIKIVDGTFDGQFAFAANQPAECTKEEVTWDITGGKFKDDPSDYLADGYVATPEEGWYSVAQSAEPVATVTLEGGEPVEYTDLHKALVAGSAAGSVVELIDNVDLKNKAWEPVADFKGTFDGKGFIISNLVIEATSDRAGLFVNIYKGTIIRNLTIDGVKITATGKQYIGALVGGFLENGENAVISNITVCGKIEIDAKKYAGVVIGHKGYPAITEDLHVIADEGSYIGDDEGSQIGGITGTSGEGSFTVANCSVSGLKIIAKTQAGGIQGRLFNGNKVIGCSTEDVTLDVTDTPFGSIVGHAQNAGATRYVINNTTDDTVNPIIGATEALPADNTVIGEGFEGDFGSFTAGTFTADAAALADVTAKCAAGYAPVANQDGTYTIMQVFPIEVVNVGGNATVTLDGDPAPTTVIAGGKITGTISGVDEGYNAFVYVDGVKVAVDNEGKFEGTATASAKITVAYVNADSWFTDPFMRNSNNAGVPNENSQGGAIDEVAGKVFLGTAPGGGSAGIVQVDIAKLIAGFGENIEPDTAFGGNYTEYYGRSLAVAPKYGVVINGNANLDTLTAHPYGGVWTNDSYAIAIEGLASNGATAYLPIAIDQDSKYLYGTDWSDGNIIVQYEIIADENDSTKIAKVVKVREWILDAVSDSGLTIARIGGKDILYTARGSNSPIFIIDTDTGAVKKVPLQHNGAAYQMAVGGVAEGMPYLMTVSGAAIEVFPLTADGLDLAGTTPMYTVAPKDVLGTASAPNRIGFAITADGKNAFIAYGKTFKGSEGNRTAVATIEKKPANLIVRGQFVTDDEVDQPEDLTPAFGAAVGKTYEAPAGYQITDVTVNGAAVAGFVAGSSFNFTNDALTAYTLVKMSLEALPVAQIGKQTYPTLNAAFEAAKDQGPVEIDVLRDCEIASSLNITNTIAVLDLNGFTVTAGATGTYSVDVFAGSDVVFSNGTINTMGKCFRVNYEAKMTIAADFRLEGTATNMLRVWGGQLDVYGTIYGSNGEGDAVQLIDAPATINVYDGALISSTGDAIRCGPLHEGNSTVNIYGGTLESRSGYQCIRLGGNKTVGNIYGGVFKLSNAGQGTVAENDSNCEFTKLTDACQAKFFTDRLGWAGAPGTLANICAPGYAPVKIGGDGEFKDYYQIVAVYNVTIAPTENGTVETSVTNGIVEGTEVTITATPATDYAVDTIAVTNGDQEVAVESNKFLMPAGNVTVYVTFKSTAVGPTWPQDWPGDADEKVVEKFATWSAANPGVDFTSEAVQNAFLMGVNADATIPTLKIESIAVEGDTATIVVSAEGVNLKTGINGVLYVDGTNELGAEWATTEVEIGSAAEFTEGKATFTVPNAKFMKAGVGFKAPAVEPVE